MKDILYFESVGRKVVIHLQSGEKRHFNGKLADVVQNLSESKASFLRTHQSYLVNYHHIKSRTKTEVTLTNDEKLPISEDRRKAFSSDFVKLLDSRC
ncbi:MAG: LytTR family transcriptional regulator [Lachnospiraceae bacterium]|nr:LytTR family transcriptional regulator [Lachnospiraceae bacterium]